MSAKPTTTKSVLATLSSIFLPVFGLEGFVFLKPKDYGKLGKTARNLAIAKVVFVVASITFFVLSITMVAKDAKKLEDALEKKDDKPKMKGTKELVLFSGYSISSGVFGILTLISIIVSIISFKKVKK